MQAKKSSFANGLFCADFPAFPGGLLCNQQGENHAQSRYEPPRHFF
jgi:hypothetical protein